MAYNLSVLAACGLLMLLLMLVAPSWAVMPILVFGGLALTVGVGGGAIMIAGWMFSVLRR